MSAEGDYLKWRHEAYVGCLFARAIARRPGNYQQVIQEVPASGAPADIATDIDQRIDGLVADDHAVAAALLFPDIQTLEKLARVMLALDGRPHWTITRSTLDPPPHVHMVAIRIARAIPFGNSTCPSEALVLGPFAEFPPTRNAPVPAFEIFIGQPRPNDPKTGQPTVKANLAHIEMNLATHKAFENLWDKSIAGRTASLGGDDNRAKAKVTFVVPWALAEQLGCTP